MDTFEIADDSEETQKSKSQFGAKRGKKKKDQGTTTEMSSAASPTESGQIVSKHGASDRLHAVVPKHAPLFSPLTVFVCGILLVVMFAVNDWKMESLSDNPSAGVSVETMITCGAKDFEKIVEEGEWWRLIVAPFLHAGIIHYVINMIALLGIGIYLEMNFGFLNIAVIYLISAVFSTAVSTIFMQEQIMVGASGAIFGLLGTLWADLIQNRKVKDRFITTFVILFLVTGINILIGFMPYLDNYSHIGGLVIGFFTSLPLVVMPTKNSFGTHVKTATWQKVLRVIGVLVTLVLFIGSMVIINRSYIYKVDEWCPWCDSLSCIELPPGDKSFWSCDACHLSGFDVLSDEQGAVVKLRCPSGEYVDIDSSCSTSSDAELTSCCVDLCL